MNNEMFSFNDGSARGLKIHNEAVVDFNFKGKFSEQFRQEVNYIQKLGEQLRSIESCCEWSDIDEIRESLEVNELRFFKIDFNIDEATCSFDLYLNNVKDEEDVKTQYIKSWVLNIDEAVLELA